MKSNHTDTPNRTLKPAAVCPTPVVNQPFQHLITACVGPLARSELGRSARAVAVSNILYPPNPTVKFLLPYVVAGVEAAWRRTRPRSEPGRPRAFSWS